MKLATDKIIKGKVVEIKEGMVMTRVKVDIGGSEIITLVVTGEALKELDPKVGDELEVLKDSGVTAARYLH
jgi:molybdopterin-binding protein